MNRISLKRMIASAAIAVLLACNVADAGASVVSYAAATEAEEAAGAEGTVEKAEKTPEKEAGEDKSEAKETAREADKTAQEADKTAQEVKENSNADETVKETPEAPAEETAEEETGEKASEAAAGEQEVQEMKEESEEETDDAQDAAASPSEEEEDVEEPANAFVPGTSTNLLDIKDTMSVSAVSTTNLKRNDTLELTFRYSIDNAKLTEAVRYSEYWTYDLSSVVGVDQTLLSLVDGAEGVIYEGASTERGVYKVDGTTVKLQITDRKWIEDPDMIDCEGSFRLSANLNGDKNADKNDAVISFPGAGDLKITFEERNMSTGKTVGASQNSQSSTTDGGNVQAVKNADGTFTLYYTITAIPNSNSKTLTVSDTLTGGQKLNQDSVTFYANGTETALSGISKTDTGFTADIASAIGTVKAGTELKFIYSTTITAEELKKAQSNSFSWTWDAGTEDDTTSVTPVYEQKLNSEKKVGGDTNNQQPYTDGQTVEVKDNGDGTYTLYYFLNVKPNTPLDTLTVTDTIGSGQTLDPSSLKLFYEWSEVSPAPNFSVSGTGFSLDIASYLENNGKTVEADKNYSIKYTTTVSASDLGKELTNNAEWTYDGGTEEKNTKIKTKEKAKEYPITKSVNKQQAAVGDVLTYTVKIGDGRTNLAGLTYKDSFYLPFEYVEGSFSMTPDIGVQPEFTNKNNLTESTVEVFTFTFPTGSYTDVYTMTYQFKIPEGSSVTGKKWAKNIGEVPGGQPKEASTEVDYGDEAKVDKEFGEWDEANKTAYFNVKVEVEDGKTVSNVEITEKETYYQTDEYHNGTRNPLKVDYSNITVTRDSSGETLSSDLYTTNASQGKITFPELSESVTVRIPVISAVPFDSTPFYWVTNTIDYGFNGSYKGYDTVTERHVPSDYTMTKTGDMDSETGITDWYVEINPSRLDLNTDHVPYFEDEIPEGMELVDGKITVTAAGKDSVGRSYDGNSKITITASVADNKIGPVDLTDFGWGDYNPAGLSGLCYKIWYKTKLTDDELSKIQTDKDVYTYTNSASETDQDGVPYKSADDTVEYTYSGLITKNDVTSDQTGSTAAYMGGQILYEVIANPNKETLNGGEPIVITDYISTNVSLITNTGLEVYGEDGTKLKDAIVSYHDDPRTLEVIIPDKTYARITFKVRALQKGEQTFDNTVTLQGKGKSQASVSEEHVVTDTGGDINADKRTITLYKIDQFDLKKTLQGAEFELYSQEVDEYGVMTGAPVYVTTATTGKSGTVKFTNLEYGKLYRWKEVKAPDGYILDDSWHNFLIYQVGSTEEETIRNRQAIWDLDDKISAANGIIVASLEEAYQWTVVNRKEPSVTAALKGSKTLTGRAMKAGEFSFQLEALDGAPLPEESPAVTIDGNTATVSARAAEAGKAVDFDFGPIKFTEIGNYNYTVTEIIPEEQDDEITYDTTVYNVEIAVTANQQTGDLETAVTINGSEETAISFSNNYEERTTDISVSKVDATSKEELQGAALKVTKIKDASGKEVSELIDSWTSEGQAREIKGLTDGTYELEENQAPLGYQTAEKITFVIKNGKLVEGGENGKVTMEDKLYTTDVEISKVDAANSQELEGATLSLTKEGQETAPDDWTWISDGSVHEVKGLTDGTYTLTEESAPEGYKQAESITFEIRNGELVTEGNDAIVEGVVTMKDEQYKGGVSISKQDLGSGAELKGAELKVTDKDGNVIDSWTSDGSQHEIKDLVDGTYTLTETSAPYGYKVSEEITFTMKAGKLVEDENAKDGVVTMKDEQYKTTVKVNKVELGSGEELAGAVLTLTNNDTGATVTWTSDGTAKEIENLIDGKYTLTEDQAPLGYFKAESIDFEISKGKIVGQDENTVVMEDQFTSIGISKTDITGEKELAGAHIQILNSDGVVVAEWDSRDDGYVTVTHLNIGEEHTLRETVAPDGYTITTDHTFIINEDKTCTTTTAVREDGVMLLQDELTSVKVSKVDIADGEEVAGAHIQILDKDGRVVAEWDSTKTAKEITGLQTDVPYTLRETVAPYGYYLTSDTIFVLNADGTVDTDTTTATVKDGVILVEDKITETKIVKTDEDYNPISGAKLQIEEGKGDAIASWTSSADGYTIIQGLKPGVTYFLVETKAPAGYKKADAISFTIDEKGNVKIKSGKGKVKDGVLVMVDKKASGKTKHTSKGSKGGKKRGARTGDDNNFMLWIVTAAAAAGGILGLVTRRRRNTK